MMSTARSNQVGGPALQGRTEEVGGIDAERLRETHQRLEGGVGIAGLDFLPEAPVHSGALGRIHDRQPAIGTQALHVGCEALA